MYLDWRKIDGYGAPITLVLAPRGIGKTFGRIYRCFKRFIKKRKLFAYVVESEEMVDELSENNGYTFFQGLIDFLNNNKSKTNDKLLNEILSITKKVESEDLYINQKTKISRKIIYLNGQVAGFIIAMNAFAKLKRNNFPELSEIIFDEFIPENYNAITRKNAYKCVSIVQSICRTKNTKVYFLGNSIRNNDPILDKLRMNNLKDDEIRKGYDDKGLLVLGCKISKKNYQDFKVKSDNSVAGRLANYMGLNELDENKFINSCPSNLLINKEKSSFYIATIHDDIDSIRVHLTSDRNEFYIFEDYGKNKNNHYCFKQKYVRGNVIYSVYWKEILFDNFQLNNIKFDTSLTYEKFKKILEIC